MRKKNNYVILILNFRQIIDNLSLLLIFLQIDDTLNNYSHKLRLYKSLAEQNLMRQSCQIASKAFIKAIASTKPGSTEHELYAILDYECRMGGAEYLAYPPVVAAGNNANTLHYIDKKQQIKNGDLILVDAGKYYIIDYYRLNTINCSIAH